MKEEKHLEILKEVLEEIETALKDPRGLLAHQRRLAFSLSLGSVTLLELYLHKLQVIKEGSMIHHEWFKRKKETVLENLQAQIVAPVGTLPLLDKIVTLAIKLEEKRDDLAYGSPAKEEVLQEKINLFFKLQELMK